MISVEELMGDGVRDVPVSEPETHWSVDHS